MKSVKIIAAAAAAALCAGAAFAAEPPAVYFTKEITPDSIVKVYEALGRKAEGKNVAVKISTGEPPSSNYLRPELIEKLVRGVNGTIVECNTAYGTARSDAENHMQVAEEHGFTKIAKVDILDAEGETALPVRGGRHLKENFVGSHFGNYDFYVVLSHFKGHAMAGLGGAVKNISIGLASSRGKGVIHANGFIESMAEAAKSVTDALGDKILYINVMNRLSVDCDCDGTPSEPEMHDIGVLASLDPVALDQACVDLVRAAPDGAALVERMESRDGPRTLEYGEEIGLGSRKYKLISLD